jgi:hypothetical protein
MLLLNIVLMVTLCVFYLWIVPKLTAGLKGVVLVPLFSIYLVGGIILAILCLMSIPRSTNELFIYPFFDLASLFVQKFVLE